MNRTCHLCSANATQSLYYADFTDGFFANGGNSEASIDFRWYCQPHAIKAAKEGARPASFDDSDPLTLEIYQAWLSYQFKNRRPSGIYSSHQTKCSQCQNLSVRELSFNPSSPFGFSQYRPYCLEHALAAVDQGAEFYGLTGTAPHFGRRFLLNDPKTPATYHCYHCPNLIETVKNQTGCCDACRKEIDDHWHESKMIDVLLKERHKNKVGRLIFVVYNTFTSRNAYFTTRDLAEKFILEVQGDIMRDGSNPPHPGQFQIYSFSLDSGKWE